MRFLLIVAVAVAAACQSPVASPTVSPGAGGLAQLIADLQAAGATVTLAGSFTTEPLSGQGASLCVNGEHVQVYVFPSVVERVQGATRIDSSDPSHIGNGIVEWIGPPRFWQRDRIVVLYVGPNAATDTLLRSVLGPPFAEGHGGGALPREGTCA